MRNGTKAASWAGVVLASLAVHAVAFGGLGHGSGGQGAPRQQRPTRVTTVEMTVAPPKAPPRRGPKRPGPQRRSRASPWRGPRPRPLGETPPPSAEPPAAAETLADFTGQTLTNDGTGAGWSSATGNGQKMNGPVGRPGARVNHRIVEGTPGGTGSGPPVVGLGDLSRTPVAPDLSDKLAAAYRLMPAPRVSRARPSSRRASRRMGRCATWPSSPKPLPASAPPAWRPCAPPSGLRPSTGTDTPFRRSSTTPVVFQVE